MAWTKKNDGVVLTPKLTNYLNQLSDKLSFDIVVTSGYRTPAKQVDAMFYKIQLGDDFWLYIGMMLLHKVLLMHIQTNRKA